jgi:hypothetical protein
MSKSAGALCLFGLLVCGAASAQGSGSRYAIDPAASDFHWLVSKAGALARLGHNHTVAVADLHGNVTKNDSNLAASRFELAFSVGALVIDDPQLRSTLGEEFASVPKPDDIAGTRKNMLSDRVLDGEKYPAIRVTGTGPTTSAGTQTLAVTVEMLGRSIPLTVPTSVKVEGDVITATGEFELNHADLGMNPFSALAGALQVGETLSFSYRITARREAR